MKTFPVKLQIAYARIFGQAWFCLTLLLCSNARLTLLWLNVKKTSDSGIKTVRAPVI